jgi:hypothetical protein
MPSTYTANLLLQKPATGEQAGLWGVTANSNYDFLDRAIDGGLPITLSSSSYTLTTQENADSPGRRKVITFNGTLLADSAVIIDPNTAQKIYYVSNKTTGGFALIFSQGSGGTFKLANGYSAVIFADGLGLTANVKGVITDLQVNSLLVLTSLTIQPGGQISWGGPATFNQPATFQQSVTIQGLATMSAGATISAPLTLTLGGDTPYDTYYRSAAGPVARLPIGSVGQVLTVTAGGPSWTTLPVQTPVTVGGAGGGGSGITGAQPGYVFFANSSGQLAQDNTLFWHTGYPALGVGKVPDRQGLIVGAGVNSSIYIDSVAPNGRNIFFTSGGVSRWVFTTTGDAESGGNHGCSLYLNGYADNGGAAITSVSFFRIGGRVTFGAVNDLGGAAQVAILGVLANQVTLYVHAAPAQTADLQQWLNPSGGVIARLDANGVMWAKGYQQS